MVSIPAGCWNSLLPLCRFAPHWACQCTDKRRHASLYSAAISLYEFFFLPTPWKDLPTFQTFCPVGVHFAQTVVHFAHFQVQARKRGVLGWGWGCFVYIHIQKGVCDSWVKNRVYGGILGKMRPHLGKMRPSGQFVWKVGKSALELGNFFPIILFIFFLIFSQWRSSAVGVKTLRINVWLPLFWSTCSLTLGPDSVTCACLALVVRFQTPCE